jgi:prepilin-type N-terminal cleavage/methylation domain-containing protein
VNRQRGYSLLEVLIALAILMIGIIAVYRLFPMSMRSARMAEEKIVASELANSRLARLRASGGLGPVLTAYTEAGALYPDEHYTQLLLAAAGDAYSMYSGYATTLQRLRGANEVYFQRALFSIQMPDGRNETFVTYVVEQ